MEQLGMPPYIFGMHDPGDWRTIFEEAGKAGWVMFNQVITDDVAKAGNREFAAWARDGFGVLVRLVNAPFDVQGMGQGSIPPPEEYTEFAQRCARFVDGSPGCHIWFIGNEMNIEWHWPTYGEARRSRPIMPEQYADCFHRVYKAIKAVQPQSWVIPSGLNPLKKPDARHEDAQDWFRDVVRLIRNLDGFDIHAYFHLAEGGDADKAYTFDQFLEWIPHARRDLPVFLTEATPPDPWPPESDGWMQRTYADLNRWNRNPNHQTVYALLPYRWGRANQAGAWHLAGKPSYRDDLRQALQHNYRGRIEPDHRLGEPMSRVEALSRIQLIDPREGGLVEAARPISGDGLPLVVPAADAYILLTDTRLTPGIWKRSMMILGAGVRGEGGLWERLRDGVRSQRSVEDMFSDLEEQAPIPVGQAVATGGSAFDARHFIFAPMRDADDPSLVAAEGIAAGVGAALTLADQLGDVRRIALPAIAIDELDAISAAEVVLTSVLGHLQAGSRLQKVAVVPDDEDQQRAYADALRALRDEGTPHGPQIWFVTGRPENWERAFRRGRVAWTEVKGAKAQQNLRQARAGDLVLAYRSTPAQHIAGLGHISRAPYPHQDRYAVDIELDLELDQGVTLTELRRVVPDLEHINIPRLSFSAVTAEQWDVIRELLVQQNPDLNPDDLPSATVSLERRIKIETVSLPDELVAGESVEIAVRLRNAGIVTWHKGEQLHLACHWWAKEVGETKGPVVTWNWTPELVEGIAPGGTLELRNLEEQSVPDQGVYEIHLTASGVDWEEEAGFGQFVKPVLVRPSSAPLMGLDERMSGPSSEMVREALAEGEVGRVEGIERAKRVGVRRKARIEDVQVPETVRSGTELEVQLQVHNAGNVAWPAGEELRVTCRWRALDSRAGDPPVLEREWLLPLDPEGLEPDRETLLDGLALTVDVEPGDFKAVWTVRGRGWGEDDQPGVALTRISVRPEKGGEGQEPGPVASVIAPTVFVPYKPTEPPPSDNTVTIEVNAQQVNLRYGRDAPYTSFNLLADKAYRDLVNQARQEGTPETYGRLLFEAIINDRDREELWSDPTAEGYAAAKSQTGGKLRWELVLNAYAEYEWECLRDEQRHLAVREDAPLYRRFYKQTDRGPVEAKPLKILVAICNPINLNAPNPLAPAVEALHPVVVDQDRFIIEEGLERLSLAGLAEYEILDNEHLRGRSQPGVTLDLLREKLQEGYHVLHLLAHGLYARDRSGQRQYHLVMELPDGRRRLEPAERFDDTILGGNLRLVILASCQSATPGAGRMLRGLGAHLINRGVPAVISMRGNVPIETVQLFTQRFYDDLARSGRIDMAMAATRGNIYQPNRKSWDWSIPVLMMSTDDGQLFEVDQEQALRKLSRLEPDIKSYAELPGGDPRYERMTQALATQAQAIGAPTHLVSAIQMMAAPATIQGASHPRPKPRAPKQDRGAISARLSSKFEFLAESLKEHVEQSSGLQLPFEVYAQTASALNAGKHVIFIGAPGTGKTSLAHDICTYAETHPSEEKSMSTGNILTTATADWTTFDTVGGYVPTPAGTLEFQPGIFLRAVCTGQWLVIDEINRAEIDKAFGELFTLLSDRQVDLPYKVGGERLRVLPPAGEGAGWVGTGRGSYDYVMHPNWRILATMNVYDKSYLFQMSFAFMRRFAFVDVDLPAPGVYQTLRRRWVDKCPLKEAPDAYKQNLEKLLDDLFHEGNDLMRRRALGPAIAKDVIRYMGDRYNHAGEEEQKVEALPGILAEAFLLYAVPQFDALDQAEIHNIYRYIARLFGYAAVAKGILNRIEDLYPHVKTWPAEPEKGQPARPETPGAPLDDDNE